VEALLEGGFRRGRAELVEDPGEMARIYADLIDDYGHERAGRRLGIRINVNRPPTHGELVDAVERSGLSFVAIDLDEEDGPYAQTEALAPGVARIALGVVNAYLVGEARGPWVLVDAGTPGSAERIRAEARVRFGPEARPEAIVLTHGHADHSGSAAELSDFWDVPVYVHRLELPFLTGLSAYPPPDPTVGGPFALMSRFMPMVSVNLGKERTRELPAGYSRRRLVLGHAEPQAEDLPPGDARHPGLGGRRTLRQRDGLAEAAPACPGPRRANGGPHRGQ
jgi:hypothetical protein